MSLEFVPTAIPGAFEVRHGIHRDSRGSFRRVFCDREFVEAGLPSRFVQTNHSVTLGAGSLRGLHFQYPPESEDKFVSCTVGRAFDVALDLRKGSPTFGRWASVEIDDATSFFIPKGCAHGFQTLTGEVHLVYMATSHYARDAESGVRFDDPIAAIDWPLPIANVSDRDRTFEYLSEAFEGLDVVL